MNSTDRSPNTTTSRRRGKKEEEQQQLNGDVHMNGKFAPGNNVGDPKRLSDDASSAEGSTTVSVLQIWAPTLLLIFGGCCSNVYTLESLIHASPTSGSLITAFQFFLVALVTAPRHLSLSRGWRNFYLRERAIPFRKWVIYTAYFLTINMLNNKAFKYRISVPLHIILRSAGPVTTMAAGRIWKGRRYPVQKIVAVLLLFSGVVLAAFSDAWSKQAEAETKLRATGLEPASTNSMSAMVSQAPGFALLASALVLSACMGLYTDDMYSTHGRSGTITAETLFYSHTMSLPYFVSQVRPLVQEFVNISAVPQPASARYKTSSLDAAGENSTTWAKYLPYGFGPSSDNLLISIVSSIYIPRPVLLLMLNAATQLLCIIGVNRLSAQSTSLTVSIVLNIRKLASLLLSIWLFGNSLPVGVISGAAVVFIGGGLYALPTAKKVDKMKTK